MHSRMHWRVCSVAFEQGEDENGERRWALCCTGHANVMSYYNVLVHQETDPNKTMH